MTTREEQQVRYWPTEAALDAIVDEPSTIGAVEWAEQNYPGGYAMNGAGQPIRQPVDDPQTRHLYPARRPQ